jgi:hypothetical protein
MIWKGQLNDKPIHILPAIEGIDGLQQVFFVHVGRKPKQGRFKSDFFTVFDFPGNIRRTGRVVAHQDGCQMGAVFSHQDAMSGFLSDVRFPSRCRGLSIQQ